MKVDAVRTPVGSHGGMLRDIDTTTLAQIVMKGILERTKLDTALIAEVIFGNVFQSSDAPSITRVAALKAGTVPAVFKESGSVTAVFACGVCDGASAMLLMTSEKAGELGYISLAKSVS